MTENEKEKKSRPLLLFGYLGIVCLFLSVCAVCYHYGWIEPREDVKYTADDMIYLSALMCGLLTATMLPRLFREYDNLHPFVVRTVDIFCLAVFIVLFGATIHMFKGEDVDWVNIILVIICGFGVLFAYAYILSRKDRNGEKYEDRMDRKLEKKNLESRIRRFDRKEVMESRSAMNLANPGMAEHAWGDGLHTYINVRRYTVAFVTMLVLISVAATVGKHLDSGDGAQMAFMLAFVIGAIMLRVFIYDPLHSAVLHGAMEYKEGAKYGLMMMGGYALLCSILTNIVIEAEQPVWDIWGYVVAAVGTFLFFVVTFLIVTLGNKHNGHDFAFFDTDGFAKRRVDPRTEEKKEEKE